MDKRSLLLLSPCIAIMSSAYAADIPKALLAELKQLAETTAGDGKIVESPYTPTPAWYAEGELWNTEMPAVLSRLAETGDATLRSPSGFTPLQAACLHGNLNLAKWLIVNWADVNARPADWEKMGFAGETPLGLAIQKNDTGDLPLTKLLLDKGALPDTPVLLQSYSRNSSSFLRRIPLISQSSAISAPVKMLLLDYGERDINKRFPGNGILTLSGVWTWGASVEFDYVKKLMERGKFNINEQAEKGTTLLLCAIRNGNLELTEFLLQQGADPNLKSRYTTMSLFHILGVGARQQELLKTAVPMAKLLVKHGADVNAMTHGNKGESLRIYYGKIKGAEPITEFLKESGAKLHPDDQEKKQTKKQKKKRS